eukprot:SAG31_NODE_4841_length_2911_cov_19.155761_4_plen_51_part_00
MIMAWTHQPHSCCAVASLIRQPHKCHEEEGGVLLWEHGVNTKVPVDLLEL